MSVPFEPVQELLDRQVERAALAGLLEDVRSGRGRSLMVRGEAGVGKSALLQYAVGAAADMEVLRAAGVQSEMELAYAAIHLLVAPLLERLDSLPAPQRQALGVAFGLWEGAAPDQFLVGLAVLTLLAGAAEDRPVLGVVDDAHWLDAASARVLGFVARRLLAERVGLVFAARPLGEQLGGLATLEVGGLPDQDAKLLLRSVIGYGLDERVRDRIVAETAGNPLALMELPRGLSAVQLAAGFGLVGAVPERIEASFRRRIDGLPAETRSFLLVAAADVTGDSLLVWRAAGRLGIPAGAGDAAQAEGVLEVKAGVRFRHPLVRSAVYATAPLAQRRAAHRALAEATDRDRDPDRRAWHLAAAASGPDEQVADELERSAGRAQGRGGMAATAAFLGRAVELTGDPARRAGRALAAAQASLQAGKFDATSQLLDLAVAGPLDELQQARADVVGGQLALASSGGGDAPALLVKAAKQLEPLDAALARETYLDAWIAALFAGDLAGAGDLHQVSEAARTAPRPTGPAQPPDLLLDGLAVLVTQGRAQAGPLLEQAAQAFADKQLTTEQHLRWSLLAIVAPSMLWDEERHHKALAREVQFCRDAGLLQQLVLMMDTMVILTIWRGDFAQAAAQIAEGESIAEATGSQVPFAAVILAGYRGAETETIPLVEAVITEARAAGRGAAVQWSHLASAILHNGLGRYQEALAAARQAAEQAPGLPVSASALPELIESANRAGQSQLAADALERLAEATSISDTHWARGIYARCRALVSDGVGAEDSYLEAIDRLSRTRLRPELARAHLLYGEWLRRQNRRVDARGQLRTAHEMFNVIGMQAFAERARRELHATGETARKRTAAIQEGLTPQETQIAGLAASGLSNQEIAAQLFLSTHTVDYHLRKVFAKIGIASRHQLRYALTASQDDKGRDNPY